MIQRTLVAVLASSLILVSGQRLMAEGDYSLKSVDGIPKSVPESLQAALHPAGAEIAGQDGTLARIWLVKSFAVKDGFKPSLSVKYPLMPGQLVGAMEVPAGQVFKDFRGQEVGGGLYTLRYGQQPEDGNHIGTSELYDFLLALPAKVDSNPKGIASPDELSQKSAQSAGSSHPAILSLLPADGVKAPQPALKHDEDKDFWILEWSGQAKDKRLPFRLVVVGESDI